MGRFIEVARAALWSLARIVCLLPRQSTVEEGAAQPLLDLMQGAALEVAAEMLGSCPLKVPALYPPAVITEFCERSERFCCTHGEPSVR